MTEEEFQMGCELITMTRAQCHNAYNLARALDAHGMDVVDGVVKMQDDGLIEYGPDALYNLCMDTGTPLKTEEHTWLWSKIKDHFTW